MASEFDKSDQEPEDPAAPGAGPAADLMGLTPGAFVRNPAEPDWGLGQVQSSVGRKLTVNFENQGKLVIDAGLVPLTRVDD